MKKIISFILSLFLMLAVVSCTPEETPVVTPDPEKLDKPLNVDVSETGLITWDKVFDATKYIVTIDGVTYEVTENKYQVADINKDFTATIIACADGFIQSDPSDPVVFESSYIDVEPPKPVISDIKIGIVGASEVKTGKSITLTANVTGTENTKVVWSIKNGSEFASISEDGVLTATDVTSDKIIKVIATSDEDNKVTASKIVTILAKPNFTSDELQDLLDNLKHEKIGFEGYLNISLYEISDFEKLVNTYTTVVKTSMDGTNWYAEYENGNVGVTQMLFYKKHNNKTCQVGVNFLNDEQYFPMEDDYGNEVSWEKGGLYNSLQYLQASDFRFNEENWRYEYVGSNKEILNRIIASANPYDFKPVSLELIIENNEILGIYMKSDSDYSILQGYKGIQELYVAINCGDSVKVPTVTKYKTDEKYHPQLQTAIDNMHNLDSYTVTMKDTNFSVYSSKPVLEGFTEYITKDECHFDPFSITIDIYGEEVIEYDEDYDYGYRKISDGLYNSYFKAKDGTYQASRAYEQEFKKAKPTFDFAAEIFNSYYYDEEEGTETYFVDTIMSGVATTFYYGLGTDIQLYGIFATDYVPFMASAYAPYVVIKDGYIIEAGFCYYLGELYGIVELFYSDFNNTTLPDDFNVEFVTRQVPKSWSELTFIKPSESGNTSDDENVNALEYLKEFFTNENIENELPFFGDVLGDTFGIAYPTEYISNTDRGVNAIQLYYDVPLDLDYTINSSLLAVEEFLLEKGFTKNEHNEFRKGDIVILPMDSQLDFMIYVWKAK